MKSLFDTINDYSTGLRGTNGEIPIESTHLYSNLLCTKELKGHRGCVNVLDWTYDGTILASGSDDTQVRLWSYPEGRPLASIYTGHETNIFGLKWLTQKQDQFVTAAGDNTIRRILMRPDGSVGENYLCECPEGRAKKVDCDPLNPHTYLVCSEDGNVYQYDARIRHDCEEGATKIIMRGPSELEVAFNSLSVCASRPEYFAVAGSAPPIYIFDRRAPDRINFLWEPLRPQNNPDDKVYWEKFEVTGVKFNRFSTDLVASYLGDRIYNFNFDSMRAGQYAEKSIYLRYLEDELVRAKHLFTMGDPNMAYEVYSRLFKEHCSMLLPTNPTSATLAILELYNVIVCLITSSRGRLPEEVYDLKNMLEANLELAYGSIHPELREKCQTLTIIIARIEAIEGVRCPEPDEQSADDSDSSASPVGGYRRYFTEHSTPIDIINTDCWKLMIAQKDVCVYGKNSYRGHLNEQTVKDVSFVGLHDELVASGSEGGVFFIWNAQTSNIVFIGRSDHHIVNGVAQHPRLPVIAVHGIDSTIKLWEPNISEDYDVPRVATAAGDYHHGGGKWAALPPAERPRLLERLAESVAIPIGMQCRAQ